MRNFFGALCIIALLSGCSTLDVFEKSTFFPEHVWKTNNPCSFTFNIDDTVSLYQIYVVIRHEDAYHFNNIWLNIATKAPGDTVRNQQVNVQLANNKKGWLGTGMDDVFDHRVRITRAPVKLKKGVYSFTLQQNMREDPLLFVLNAGIRVEKQKP